MRTRTGTRFASSPASNTDHELFPPAFLRLLAALPAAVARIRAGASEGRRATPGQGGRFLFRGHRVYRPGDDLRRVDWKVAARLGRLLVRQFDAERDLLTEVWLDGSASMEPWGGRVKSARAAALACAVGVATAGRTRLGLLSDGTPRVLLEASQPGRLVEFLQALSSAVPAGRADLSSALPRLVKRVPPKSRLVLISDLLSRAEPGLLHALAGRGLRGALMHLRVPQVTAPRAAGTQSVRDVETEIVKTIHFDEALVARVAARARKHAKAWALHGNAGGLHYVPFAPTTPDEDLLRRLAGDLP